MDWAFSEDVELYHGKDLQKGEHTKKEFPDENKRQQMLRINPLNGLTRKHIFLTRRSINLSLFVEIKHKLSFLPFSPFFRHFIVKY